MLVVSTPLLKEGQESPERPAGLPLVNTNEVSPGHFTTLEIPLLAGRDFLSSDPVRRRPWPLSTKRSRGIFGPARIHWAVACRNGAANSRPGHGWRLSAWPKTRNTSPSAKVHDRAVALALAAIGLYGGVVVPRAPPHARDRHPDRARRTTLERRLAGSHIGLRWTITAIALGLLASVAVTRVMSGLLYGVGSIDPLVFAVVPLVLAATAYAACWFPGRSASRVDPLAALRVE